MSNKYIKWIAMCVFLGFLVIFSGLNFSYGKEKQHQEDIIVQDDSSEEVSFENKETADEKATIFVHVCGAVKKPGVYELPADSRICDAITAAKGVKKKAADTLVNQAEPLMDGQQIIIPYKEKRKEQKGNDASANDDEKVNINTASLEELKNLTGIGDAKAASIVQYREEHGAFSNIEELKNISGIKDGVYSKIAADITV